MVKKILGGLYIFTAVCTVVGGIANESLGSLLPAIVFTGSGIFLIIFDNVKKLNFTEGFKKRKTQNTIIIVFLAIYAIFTALAIMGSFMTNYLEPSFTKLLIIGIVSSLPYIISLGVFGGMLGVYVTPFSACNKNFNCDANINIIFHANDAFMPYSADSSVLANSKVLFFPDTFCIIPFNQIASTKSVNMGIEKDVYFTLTNGKKFSIASKRYDEIMNAINYNKANQNTPF